jgi:raffinose/stachyose/melibiose transport system permease protein
VIRRVAGMGARHFLLVLFSLAALFPLWFMVVTALKTQNQFSLDPTGFPSPISASAFRGAFDGAPILRWMLNSVIVTVSSVAAAVIVAALAAYAMAFGRIRGRQLFLGLNVGLMIIPPVVLLLPMFIFAVDTGLINTYPSVIIFYVGLLIPFSIFFLYSFFRAVPYELFEAVAVDGGSPFFIFRKVIVPLAAAPLFTLVLVNAIWVWNELLIALVFLQNNNTRTLMAGLTLFQGRYDTNDPLLAAATVVSIVPIVGLYAFGQRFFVKGLIAGMGK